MVPLMHPHTADSIEFDFLDLTVNSSLQFTRSSSGSYYDSSGVLKQATSDTPRFDYDPNSLTLRGLLLEEQRQNLVLSSNNLAAGSGWNLNASATRTNVTSTAPDNTNTALQLATTTSAFSGVFSGGISVLSGLKYTYSLYVKPVAGGTTITFGCDNATAYGSTVAAVLKFDTATKAFTSIGSQIVANSYNYELCQNGWMRVWFTATTIADTVNSSFIIFNGSSPSTSEFQLWGVQVENGEFPTSLMVTTGVTSTRAIDTLFTTDLWWFDAVKGTYYVELMPQGLINPVFIYAQFSDGTVNNKIMLTGGTGGTVNPKITVSGTGYVSGTSTVTQFTTSKMAMRYTSGDNQATIDGVLMTDGTMRTAPLPTGINRLDLSTNIGAGNSLSGWLRKFTYTRTALTEAQLIALTT